MNIDKGKCDAWSSLLLALLKMSRDLNDDEYRYIRANFSIAFGKLELQNLEKKQKCERKN